MIEGLKVQMMSNLIEKEDISFWDAVLGSGDAPPPKEHPVPP
jgi:hypothetical protein